MSILKTVPAIYAIQLAMMVEVRFGIEVDMNYVYDDRGPTMVDLWVRPGVKADFDRIDEFLAGALAVLDLNNPPRLS